MIIYYPAASLALTINRKFRHFEATSTRVLVAMRTTRAEAAILQIGEQVPVDDQSRSRQCEWHGKGTWQAALDRHVSFDDCRFQRRYLLFLAGVRQLLPGE